MKTVVRPVVEVVNLTATDPDGRVNVRTSARQPRSVVVKVPGPQGPTGSQGPKGDKGDTGDSALTFAVGTVTTGAAGSSASVTDVGSDGNVVLDFVIPRGDLGVEVDEGSGAADGDILVYDANADVWVPHPPEQPGKVISVSSALKSDTQTMSSVASGSSVAVSGLSVTVTPRNSSSKFFITGFVSASADLSSTVIGAGIKRDSSFIGDGNGSIRTEIHSAINLSVSGSNDISSAPINFLDSPGTTSSITYSVELFNLNAVGGTAEIYVNRSEDDETNANAPRAVSVLTVMEIAG